MAKNNKYSHFNEPQKDLDFHGLDRFMSEEDYKNYTEDNLKQFKKDWLKVVRLVVGKGNNSKNGPVIKPIIQRFLHELKMSGFIKNYDYDTAWRNWQNTWAFIVKF